MTDILLIDFESRSRCDLPRRGTDQYTIDPSTAPLCMSWGYLNGQLTHLWLPGEPVPNDLRCHVEQGGLVAAHNAEFDKGIWRICEDDHDFPPVENSQWYCSSAQMRVAGLPASLENAGRALTAKMRKDYRGQELIRKLCVPDKDSGEFNTDPALMAELFEYGKQDLRAMRACMLAAPLLPEAAHQHWLNTTTINARGIHIDRELCQAAEQYAERERAELGAQLDDATCGAVTEHTQTQRFREWLQAVLKDDGCDEALDLMVRYKKGERKISADKAVRASLMAGADELNLAPDVREVLALVEDAGGSAIAKYTRMLQMADLEDDRIRGALVYAGAPSTQRFSSKGCQVHNFRRDAYPPEEQTAVRASIIAGQIPDDLRVIDVLSRYLRSAITPEKGNVFVVGDWSMIESIFTAWLAGDEDKLNLFRTYFKTGNPDYEPYMRAARLIYPGDSADANPDSRQIGKIAELSCGFAGGAGAFLGMASGYGVHVTKARAQTVVDRWRAGHPKVVALWNDLEAAARRAIGNPGHLGPAAGGKVQYLFAPADGALYVTLPDGETLLRYPEARIEMRTTPWGEKSTITALKAAFTPGGEDSEWPRHAAWRGVLVENIVQATCASLLRQALRPVVEQCVFHVHDEIVLEVPRAEKTRVVKQLKRVMETSPDWCADAPLSCQPVIMERYGK